MILEIQADVKLNINFRDSKFNKSKMRSKSCYLFLKTYNFWQKEKSILKLLKRSF